MAIDLRHNQAEIAWIGVYIMYVWHIYETISLNCNYAIRNISVTMLIRQGSITQKCNTDPQMMNSMVIITMKSASLNFWEYT